MQYSETSKKRTWLKNIFFLLLVYILLFYHVPNKNILKSALKHAHIEPEGAFDQNLLIID